MRLTPEEFMKKAVINETELVRDYMHFADHIEGSQPEVAKLFRHWAEEDGLRAHKIKDILGESIDDDDQDGK
ncbi:MAG TPA: ferritin family protein [Bacillota bacterium]|nr:ferritin family protein [Bacillota bacterium]